MNDALRRAAWISPGLGGAFGAVARTVPRGYPAYARILHPPADPSGALTTWSDVARATGREAHALMQWDALTGSLWRGSAPRIGHLVPETLRPLCALLANSTSTPAECFFGVWDGWGWIGNGDRSPVEVAGSPRLSLPGRDYLLLAGPVDDALRIGHWPRPNWFIPQSPSIFWPSDRAWFAATEIDFDSTLVAGSSDLIDALVAALSLETWAVRPGDSLAAGADTRNPD